LRELSPEGRSLYKEFEEIIKQGASGKEFEHEHNEKWTHHTRPFVEAFFHAKFFLEMIVKYGCYDNFETPYVTKFEKRVYIKNDESKTHAYDFGRFS